MKVRLSFGLLLIAFSFFCNCSKDSEPVPKFPAVLLDTELFGSPRAVETDTFVYDNHYDNLVVNINCCGWYAQWPGADSLDIPPDPALCEKYLYRFYSENCSMFLNSDKKSYSLEGNILLFKFDYNCQGWPISLTDSVFVQQFRINDSGSYEISIYAKAKQKCRGFQFLDQCPAGWETYYEDYFRVNFYSDQNIPFYSSELPVTEPQLSILINPRFDDLGYAVLRFDSR